MAQLRTAAQRKADVLSRLQKNGEAFLATASQAGEPRLIAVSFWWNGTELIIATRQGTPTARNLQSTRAARLALGPQEDVIMIDARVAEQSPVSSAKPELRQGFLDAAGWDPAEEGADWAFFRLGPVRIEAYRGYGELEGRMVMRDSRWLV